MRKDGVILAESRTEHKAIGRFTGIAAEQRYVDEHPANCRLIETAPELYEALKRAELFIENCTPAERGCFITLPMIKAAIAKAESAWVPTRGLASPARDSSPTNKEE